jgi:hypothetical protein
MRRKHLFLSIGLVAAASMAAAYFWMSRDPLAAAAARLAGCVQSRDADCVFEYIDSEDRAVYQLDPKKVEQMLAIIGSAAEIPRGKPVISRPPNVEILNVRVPARSRKSGRPFSFGFMMSRTGEGPKSPGFVTASLLGLSMADAPVVPGEAGAITKLRSWAEYAANEGARWEGAGVKGIFRDPEEGLIPWRDWEANCRQRLERAKASVAQSKQ